MEPHVPSSPSDTQAPAAATPPPFSEWCIIDLFGHQRIAGRVSEATIAGGAFLRVEVPKDNGETDYTRFYSPSAVYSMSPVARQIAIAFVLAHKPEPVTPYDITKLARQSQLTLPDEDPDDRS
jgi:hypothetical protein